MEMAKVCCETGLPHKHEIVKGMEHQYPDNESKWIDKAILFLLTDNQ
jgi:hypothetical protein